MAKSQKAGHLRARCSSELQEKLDEVAAREGIKPSELIRRFIQAGLAGEQQAIDVRPLSIMLGNLQKSLAPISSNLNQIAKAYHIQGVLDNSKIAMALKLLQQEQKKLTTELKEIRYDVQNIIS